MSDRPEEPTEPPSQELSDQVMADYWAYEKAVADAGVKLGGNALQGSQTATTVRLKDGRMIDRPVVLQARRTLQRGGA